MAMPSLAQVYAERVGRLQASLDAGKGQEILEAARALIDKVIVTRAMSPTTIPPALSWSAI